MGIEDYDDHELIALTQKGNPQAFGVIVKRYKQRAYYVALGLVSSHEDALDLSQEAFVRAYQAIKRFQTNKQFFTWYYQILRNLCFNFNRDRKKHAYSFSEMAEDNVVHYCDPEAVPPDEVMEKKELAQQVWLAIQNLSEMEKEIIILREFQNMNYKEIAKILQCPIGTVMSRLYNARKHLANVLKKEYDGLNI